MYDYGERLALDADGTEGGERAFCSRICTDKVCVSLRHFMLVRDSAHVTRATLDAVGVFIICVLALCVLICACGCVLARVSNLTPHLRHCKHRNLISPASFIMH